MGLLEDIQSTIESGKPKDTERLIQQALDQSLAPEAILEQAMIPAMRAAGDAYRNNDADIPRILAAARSMRKGLSILEPHLEPTARPSYGLVILGTVEGDLHDVGKTLVAIMFRSVGFEVLDLGVDVSEKQFLRAVKEHPEVKIICISSLLTTSMPEMRRIVKSLKANIRPAIKIMVGGGSVTQEFADAIGADFYTENAVDAAETAKAYVLAQL